MSRAAVVLILGGVITVLGTAVLLWTHTLAGRWEQLGAPFWNGRIEPATERGVQFIGLSVLAFGLGLMVLAAHHWLIEGREELAE